MIKALGISAFSHDAAVSVVHGDQFVFGSHAERYSRIKNDKMLAASLVDEALEYGNPDVIAYYERPLLKRTRQLYSGQYDKAFASGTVEEKIRAMTGLKNTPIEYVSHHKSHAAAGAYTSGFDDACVIVIDAIGEWDCLSMWKYNDGKLTKLYSQKYPNSLGLFYTAMTQRVGLKPNEDEYILMGMAAYGNPIYADQMEEDFFYPRKLAKTQVNLHFGCLGYLEGADKYDIAASAQLVLERKLHEVFQHSKRVYPSDNLVYMGGVALNCSANIMLNRYYRRTWIMPNPGDAGSSLGACLGAVNRPIQWTGPFTGKSIGGDYPVQRLVDEIIRNKIVGVASGRAEFGPRAFGNRSLLADPRGDDIKDRVNEIKKRQKFRPFAPVILEELADEYFDMRGMKSSPYMQYTFDCKHPDKFPAIVHADNTSRVQTVSKQDHAGLYEALTILYEKHNCPMLLNTSLNIKGQPMVNTRQDADDFEQHYGVTVIS